MAGRHGSGASPTESGRGGHPAFTARDRFGTDDVSIIITPGSSCGNKETLLTWPAAPTASLTFYERSSSPQLVRESFVTTAVAFCDDPADLAVSGGFRTEGMQVNEYIYHVFTSLSCEASGLCSGPSGQDGWVVLAKGNMSPAAGVTVIGLCHLCPTIKGGEPKTRGMP